MSELPQHPPPLLGPDCMPGPYLSCRDVETGAQEAVAFWRGQPLLGEVRVELGSACLQLCGLLSAFNA